METEGWSQEEEVNQTSNIVYSLAFLSPHSENNYFNGCDILQ
jgi:hypothetical protein